VADPVVLINVFEVPSEEAEAFLAAWQRATDYLSGQPGFVDTSLHQALSPDTGFQFVNLAHWRTAEEFTAAIGSEGFRAAAAGMAGSHAHPALYRVVART
jgi:heme-degrading monooxygenase HmoA